jgi:hypothetical protein
LKVELVHQVKNETFKRARHFSDHDPCIFVLDSRVKKTFKIKKSKIYNEEEFSYHYNNYLSFAKEFFPKN